MNEDIIVAPPSAPAQAATATLFDSTADPGDGTTLTRRRAYPQVRRASIKIRSDRAGTFYHDEIASGSTTWRTLNGGGSGSAVAANDEYSYDGKIIGEDFRFRFVEGNVGAVTTWEVTIKLVVGDRSAGT